MREIGSTAQTWRRVLKLRYLQDFEREQARRVRSKAPLLHGEEFSNYAIYKTLNGSKPDA